MINHEMAEYLVSEISTISDRNELRDRARHILGEKFSLEHDVSMLEQEKPSLWEKFSGSQEKIGKQFNQNVDARNKLLGAISERTFSLEEQERQTSKATWDNLKPILEKAGVIIPQDFTLGIVDLSKLKERAYPGRVLKQTLPADMNGRLFVEIDGRIVRIEGQSIHLHGSGCAESVFLRILDDTQTEGNLNVEFSGTTRDMADVNRMDHYEASFEFHGWKFTTTVSYPYDSTIEPGRITKEGVIKELGKYRETRDR